jgi:hypothetical protein
MLQRNGTETVQIPLAIEQAPDDESGQALSERIESGSVQCRQDRLIDIGSDTQLVCIERVGRGSQDVMRHLGFSEP